MKPVVGSRAIRGAGRIGFVKIEADRHVLARCDRAAALGQIPIAEFIACNFGRSVTERNLVRLLVAQGFQIPREI